MAAAATITEVYVVAAKEDISFEKALHKYPWVAGLFSRPQIHPMIGRAVCPVYKREVVLPIEDTMDFDIEILPSKSGPLEVRQVYSSWWRNIREEWFPNLVLFIGLLALLYKWQGLDGYIAVAPYAGFFYMVRAVADASMGIEWGKQYSCYP